MKRKLIILLFLLLLLLPFNCLALEYPNLHYENAIIYDLTNDEVLYELKSDEVKSIASLTKLMTIITAIENNTDWSKKIIYNQNMKNNVAWYASVAGFKVGDILTFDDLLYSAMLPSGADATVALAIATSGSLDSFVEKMNLTAKKIGMKDSNFVNVHGLDEQNHYSTAADIQKLLVYALKNSKFKEVYTTKEYTLSTGQKIKSTIQKQADISNIDISKIKGSKTGFTNNAGLCISVLMNHKNHDIVIITLGAEENPNGIAYNLSDALTLIDFIEKNYNNQTIIKKNKLIKKVVVKNSKQETYKIKASQNITAFLENDYKKEKIKVKYSGKQTLSYQEKKGTKIGQLSYYYDNKLLLKEDIIVTIDIQPSIFKIIKSNIVLIITIFISCIFAIFLFKDHKNLKRKLSKK